MSQDVEKPTAPTETSTLPFAESPAPPPTDNAEAGARCQEGEKNDTDSAATVAGEQIHEDPLAAVKVTRGGTAGITGEEDEDVRHELRGVKLFVKRGDKEFSDGILGHVKLLSRRETSEERLVFRREPVWKVSMSVGLRPTTRCTFDETQNVLRITLKETIEQQGIPAENWPQQVVVYALRRGKTSKSDFAAFAKVAAGNPQLLQAV